jgi:DNA repair exonuclease SbcCD ATPase subunit
MTAEELETKLETFEKSIDAALAKIDASQTTNTGDPPPEPDKGDQMEETQEQVQELSKKLEDISKALEAAEARAKAAEEIAKRETEARRLQDFVKQAEAAYPSLPGTPEEKGQALKAVKDLLPEAEATVLTKMLEAGNTALKSAMSEVGKSAASSASTTWEKIEKMAETKAATGNISKAVAVSQILAENPDLYTEYLKEK